MIYVVACYPGKVSLKLICITKLKLVSQKEGCGKSLMGYRIQTFVSIAVFTSAESFQGLCVFWGLLSMQGAF
jgi:hypothetical protein